MTECENSFLLKKKIILNLPLKFIYAYIMVTCLLLNQTFALPQKNKQPIKALYIPLADHYAAIVAYELYRHKMKYANFELEQMKSWDLLRAYFQSEEVDMAFVMSPLAMDMFSKKPHFRWIGLMHRDGNALAINDQINQYVQLPLLRKDRKPDEKVALALKKIYKQMQQPIEVGMPHQLSTHTVILYRYLKEHGLNLSLLPNESAEVYAITIAPPKAPAFIKGKNNRAQAAAFEQSLPWADIVETGGFGHVAWYSKNVMPWKHGHVECIALATNKAISSKTKAINEIMFYIHQAGQDIEIARNTGGQLLEDIVNIVQKHIPLHSRQAIIASLNPDLKVINYQHLNIDKAGLKQIMDFAVEGKIIKNAINIDEFADEQFIQKTLTTTNK